ncbi:MAG: hypothetical protein EAZ89_02170 [Bacteroidetes bacterium]|nr:MAG: hypothetical protein EAZ89_02170 [Bacteroidota bacterium]
MASLRPMNVSATTLLVICAFQLSSCARLVKDTGATNPTASGADSLALTLAPRTVFPQIHAHLQGMVTEFVRAMYQDKKGNYWFGTNTNGIIRYDGQTLEKVAVEQQRRLVSVREIVEDSAGNIWFGTSSGLVKYDGATFTPYSTEAGLPDEEIWSLTVDSDGLMWVGSVGGVSLFDGKTFTPFLLPESTVENSQPMLSDQLVFRFLEDKNGTMWLVTDGNGIFKYKNGEFIQLTSDNGLTDNQVSDILEDKQGNIWIGTFNGGVSTFDGKTYTNFTKDGMIEGAETYNFCEDSQGNIWFSAEGYGVYRYDGTHFTRFSTEDGLTTNTVQSIFEDRKGHIWFGTWQGMSLYDGQKIMDVKDKEPWTK